MKSIVLCERTLVQESEDFGDLKEEKVNEEGNAKAEEKKIFNGIPDSEKPESYNEIFEKCEVILKNDEISSKSLFKEEVSDNDEKKTQPSMACAREMNENFLSDDSDISVEMAENSLYSNKRGRNCSIEENLSSKSKILENVNSLNSSTGVLDQNSRGKVDFSVGNDEDGDDAIQIIETEGSQNLLGKAGNDSLKRNSNNDAVEKRKLKNVESKDNMDSLENIILDLDENKENEKEEITNALEDCSDNHLINKSSSEYEIQVGDVQTISGLEKDSMWAENDLKKSEEVSKENLDENLVNDCQDNSISNEESTNTVENEKDENHELESDENIILEAEENVEERMHIEVEEVEQTEELKIEGREREQIDLDNFFTNKNISDSEIEDIKTNYLKIEGIVCRKRQISRSGEENPFPKKKRLWRNEEKTEQIQSEENTEGSSGLEGLASLDDTNFAPKDESSPEGKTFSTKRTLDDDKDTKKFKSSVKVDETKTKYDQTAKTMFSVLEKFRGAIKTLTRSDLEELIVQKLCEVITERSNVGELRRKAQALEQDQERWKAKAQSLTKQMREMEMVMRKYMSEVQKQIKEGDTHVVTPLKVTRSVGLQVSFYSSANKGSKPNLSQPSPSSLPQNINSRNGKGPSPKLPPQFSPVTQNVRNKSTPTFQKGSPLLQKSPISQQRRPIVPKPDYSSAPSNRSTVAQRSLLNNNRGTSNQVQAPKPNYKPAAGASTQQQQSQNPQQQQQLHHPQQQQQQQQQPHHQQQQQPQNGSKVIDLTEDDDRQTANTVKASGPVRVINHLTQPPVPQNNRFAYLLPTTSASTGSSVGPSRQVLIATPTMPQPNRQIMCSMPPLLFKGSTVQSGSQPQMHNQSNKFILPKTLRHPAPLPQRPVNQSTKRNLKLLPPRPALKISKVQTGIVLSWNMSLGPEHAPIASYQLYAYQESDSPPATSLWKKVGDVKALPLPMACTLTQFMSGHKYHFAVRAIDLHSRIGPFSYPRTIVLV